MLGIKAVAWFFYNFTSTPVFINLVFEFDDWAREGLQRLEQGQLYGLALVMYTCLAVQKKFNVKYTAITVGIVSFITFITQSRNGMAAAVGTVGVICYFGREKGAGKLRLRALLVVGVILILLSGIIPQLIESASLSGAYGGSTLIRIKNWNYFMDLIFRKRRIFGMGLLDARNETASQILFYGSGNRYYLEDLGILGGVVKFGILFVVVYIWLFVLIGKTCWKCYKNRDYRYFPLLIGMAAYIASCGLMQNIFDSQRSYGTAFFLATISYIDAETRRMPQQSRMGENRERV